MQTQTCAGFIDDVNGFVWQAAVIDVPLRQLCCRFERSGVVMNAVVLLEARFQAMQDSDSLFERRLRYIYFLETSRKCMIFLKYSSVFFVSRRTDAANLAVRQNRLDQVARIQDAARGSARADDGVDFVDEQHRTRIFLNFLDDAFETFFKIAAILGTGDQRSHVECVYRAIEQYFGNALFDDHARQTFG